MIMQEGRRVPAPKTEIVFVRFGSSRFAGVREVQTRQGQVVKPVDVAGAPEPGIKLGIPQREVRNY